MFLLKIEKQTHILRAEFETQIPNFSARYRPCCNTVTVDVCRRDQVLLRTSKSQINEFK